MRSAAFVAILLASQIAAAENRVISVGADAIATVSAAASPVELLAYDDEMVVLEVEDEDLEDIAHVMHEQHGRCGGFIVHDTFIDALARPGKPPPMSYTLDRPAEVKAVLATLEKERLLGTIRELSAMPNRFYKSSAGAAASTWLADTWRGFSERRDITIELVEHKGWPQKSVMLTIPGTTRASEHVVIGGHLDSITFRSGNAPGADDDASGIATMTETLRALLANDFRPERTLVFVAYAAEEVGLRGSSDVVKLFQQRGTNVVGALQLDMTNYKGSNKDIWLLKDFTSATQNEFMISLIDTYVGATWGLDACGYACSDHASWYRAGVHASMPFESRMSERNMRIHTAEDTLETSGNNADHAIKFARLAAAYAIELAKGTTSSTGKDSDDRGAVLAILAMLGAAGYALQRRITA
jgi:leucyl aminopeptidase